MNLQLFNDNCLETLKRFPENSVDSVVTDPPYGLGKEPDVVEVMKSWIETGFHEVTGSGFMGKEWDAFVPQPLIWKEVFRVLKPGGHILCFSGTRTVDWMGMSLRFAGFEIRDTLAWVYGSGFPKSVNIGKAVDSLQGNEREVVGKDKSGSLRNCMSGNFTGGEYNLTKGDTEWEGWGTALKPAIEPIILARKPLSEKTIVENVLRWGTGGINIDDCRIEIDKSKESDNRVNGNSENIYRGTSKNKFFTGLNGIENNLVSEKGKFPSNFIHDGSEEVLKNFPYTKSGSIKKNSKVNSNHNSNSLGKYNGYILNYDVEGDEGSASRFFYCAKPSEKERSLGLERNEFVRHSDRTKDDGVGGNNPKNRSNNEKQNFHPTVKPLKLMKYLIKLVTPKNGIVLDPFMGSGTTGVACKFEDFGFIGIELMPEYFQLAETRIKNSIKEDDYDFIF
jgi:site-specific DNA-methyltransferase (adenine-specific)